MSNLKSLRQLSIRGCQHLQTVPNLEVLMSLEVLDLFGTAVTHIPALENFSNLRQLLLRGCSNLKGFIHVEMIDLLGTTVKELPYGISKLTHLECLDLPHTGKIQGAESRNMKSLPEVEDPYQWSMSRFDNPHIAISGIQFLQILKKNPSSLETRFHLCIHPTNEKNKNGYTYSYRNDHIFGDILFRTAEFDRFKEQRSLEIHGFDLFPSGVGDDVLCNADCVFFINNTFNKWFSDIGVSSLQAIKGYWIERCTKMEGVFQAGKEDDIAELGLEILGISNAKNLSSIHSGNLLENLEALQVRFCDKLETVFEQSSPEPELQNLETLYLWKLPELTNIGCILTSLQTLKVWECPKLQKLEDTLRLAESLQTLWISNVVDLKNIYSGSQQLETLILESCPMLETIVPSLQQPQSPMTIKIKSSNKLKPVFGSDTLLESIMQ
ncbi:putative disease resistance protein At4g19050 [Camellia sinensis]|uniref:putative disease resistance protein At4g19050 n=1 Tax=Camellia sinensis TaxID=4442 RepID=UPI0010366618|nr:putative disease resistance protein At4g19050 [Camellia sinensis]